MLAQVFCPDGTHPLFPETSPTPLLLTRPGGAHWQGGAGCRDQTRLSLKDGAKYRGASASGVMKTKSAKAQRVGKAGAIAAACLLYTSDAADE